MLTVKNTMNLRFSSTKTIMVIQIQICGHRFISNLIHIFQLFPPLLFHMQVLILWSKCVHVSIYLCVYTQNFAENIKDVILLLIQKEKERSCTVQVSVANKIATYDQVNWLKE